MTRDGHVDEDDIQDDINRATAIGLENAQILALAANWCEHIGVTRGPMGESVSELTSSCAPRKWRV